MDHNLRQAYINTDYIIDDELGFWQINIGDTDRPLSRYLNTFENPTAAFITAYNPKSKRLKEGQNQQRQQQLHQAVSKLGLASCKGYGLSQQNDWPKEHSLLITNITKQQASQLAKDFQQAAFVWIDDKGLVSLVTQQDY
ncbi:DUF3293 domain-containing protein [Thalassotalea nanhaiensis]|uniref:DUF3293 domain-containing protein n=1 Tax=Thalassotalea nanhaiensis TaxID=3065648 RepID=A0ABY9TQP2_9GAMM|nr:DUF3293 domain-containing protein [Colwelliaceae bacterium SQ345]